VAAVSGLRRLVRIVLGAEIDRALRPLLAVSLTASLAGSAFWSFMAIWAIDELGASSRQLAVGFLVGAAAAGVVGYAGGHLSDHFGRRRLMLAGQTALFLLAPLFLLVDHQVAFGLGLMVTTGAFASLGGSVGQALVADLVPPDRHEAGYATVRVSNNLGVTMGPPIGSLFLVLGGWHALFIGVALLAAGAWLLSFRLLPARGAFSPEAPPERGSLGVITRDRLFLVFLASSLFAWMVYVAYETVLPVSLVDTHGLAPAAWGVLLVVNPVLVTLCQMRLTRAVERVPPAPKLVAAMLLMGLPFLLFGVSAAIPVILAVLILFVIGEMLWVPTSQAIVAGLAPEDIRGAYMGAFGSMGAAGFALAPFSALQVRAASGDDAMWAMFAVIAVASALLGVVACRGVGRAGRVPSAVLET
jgi:predicted MFS family arabinose efflux permease